MYAVMCISPVCMFMAVMIFSTLFIFFTRGEPRHLEQEISTAALVLLLQ